MNIIKCKLEPQWGNMYILEENNHYVLIDPCIIELPFVNASNIDYIFLTHEHYDHVSGVNYWRDQSGASVVCSILCDKGLRNSNINLSNTFQQFCAIQSIRDIDIANIKNMDYISYADITYEEHYYMNWQGNEIEFYSLPGHSKGSSGILVNGMYLFAGDSLLRDYPVTGCFVGSSKDDWQEVSLPKIKALDKSLHVYPGHFEDFDLQDYKYWDQCKFRRSKQK